MRPDFVEIIKALRDVTAAGIRVALPGRVTRVDAAKGQVSVRPELRVPRLGQNNTVEHADVPELLTVPVLWPGTAVVEITMEVREGDPGMIFFADFHLGAWLDAGALVNPVIPDAHGAHGAVFVPGLFPQDERPALPTAPLRVRMGLRGGARVEVADGEVRALAGGSAESLAYKSDADALNARISAVENAFNAFIAVWTTFVGAYPGAPGAASPSASSAIVEGTQVFKGE